MTRDKFIIVKNLGYEDEQIVFMSYDHNMCVKICNVLMSESCQHVTYSVCIDDEDIAITNQCDGCARGFEVSNGIHIDINGVNYISCSAHLYK